MKVLNWYAMAVSATSDPFFSFFSDGNEGRKTYKPLEAIQIFKFSFPEKAFLRFKHNGQGHALHAANKQQPSLVEILPLIW